MSAEQTIGMALALFLMGIGLMGSLLPILPSTPLILAVAIGHRIYFGAASINNSVLLILVVITLFSLLLDYLASMLGAKRLGASWLGVLGAVVGAMVGIFFSLLGILLGPFLGALSFEILGGRNFAQSTRAGVGAVLGLAVGAAAKLGCCLVMILLFVVNVWSRTTALHGTGGVEVFWRASGLGHCG